MSDFGALASLTALPRPTVLVGVGFFLMLAFILAEPGAVPDLNPKWDRRIILAGGVLSPRCSKSIWILTTWPLSGRLVAHKQHIALSLRRVGRWRRDGVERRH